MYLKLLSLCSVVWIIKEVTETSWNVWYVMAFLSHTHWGFYPKDAEWGSCGIWYWTLQIHQELCWCGFMWWPQPPSPPTYSHVDCLSFTCEILRGSAKPTHLEGEAEVPWRAAHQQLPVLSTSPSQANVRNDPNETGTSLCLLDQEFKQCLGAQTPGKSS